MVLVMILLYLIQRKTHDAGIVDAGWAAGVGMLAIFYAIRADGDQVTRVLLGVLAGLWGVRLAGYILKNRVLAPSEDGRYQMLREKWGEKAQFYLFCFFQIQAFWAVLFAIPFLPVAYNQNPLHPGLIGAALVIWFIAVGGETLADWQLARYRAQSENLGKTCRVGLWKYSRHPNYFFEWLHWFTYVFLAIGSPYVWVSFFGPVIMLIFLYKITGIPYTEKRALLSRGEDYRQYQQTTSAFIPWFPKKEKA
ncbi:DUF1295 domain-containing protein [Planctomycetota bacterium]